jgi:hypothetical protein
VRGGDEGGCAMGAPPTQAVGKACWAGMETLASTGVRGARSTCLIFGRTELHFRLN